ncbi:MAG TPA: heme o synthase [Thermoplasmata archaeon]|nr:heme o synthase [Thermoplasmata archaeon]
MGVVEERGNLGFATEFGPATAATTQPWWDTLLAYGQLLKPRMVALLVFTAAVGMVVSTSALGMSLTPGVALWGLAAIIAGTAGCNAITGYVDRDIDRLMERTRDRPLCTGRISPASRAVWVGAGLLGFALILSGLRNPLALAFMALGIADNVVIYSLWLKRTSRWNIVLGGISGGMPVAFGWAFASGTIGLAAVLLAAMVVLWTPTHIWSLALRYRDDYARAGIPMLPVVTSEKTALRCMVVTGALLVPFSLALPFATSVAGLGYVLVAAALGVPLLAMSVWLWVRPTPDRAWTLFKFSSPYLAVVFLALMVSALW